MSIPNPGQYKVWYEVRFRIYQYNSGAGDNGTFTHLQEFDTLNDALGFKQVIELIIDPRGETGKSKSFCDDYCYHGFLREILGIYKCEERKVW